MALCALLINGKVWQMVSRDKLGPVIVAPVGVPTTMEDVKSDHPNITHLYNLLFCYRRTNKAGTHEYVLTHVVLKEWQGEKLNETEQGSKESIEGSAPQGPGQG